MRDQIKLRDVKDLFYSSQLEKFNLENISFNEYLEIQLFKGLSYFQSSHAIEGKECLNMLMEELIIKKGDIIDEIDLLIQVLYLWQIFDRNSYTAEQMNFQLLKKIQSYKDQTQNELNFNKGIYQIGLSMHEFIETYRNSNDLKCIDDLKQSLELVPTYKYEIMNLIGCMYSYKQQETHSLEWNEKLYRLNPKYPGVANNLALGYKSLDKQDEALECYKLAEQLCPKNSTILTNIGLYYEGLNENEKALEYYKKSYVINPINGYSCFKYGQFLIRNDQKEEGLKILKQSSENDPSYCQVQMELYSHELENQNYQKCTEYLQKCIDCMPNNGYYHYKMGEHLIELQQYAQALECFKKSLSLKLHNSICQHANSYLAFCYFRLGRLQQSLEQFLKTYNLNFKSMDYDSEVNEICFIFNSTRHLSEHKKIEIISNLYGPIQMRFNPLIEKITSNNIQNMLKQRQDAYRQVLQNLASQTFIIPELIFQSQISHWDLFID